MSTASDRRDVAIRALTEIADALADAPAAVAQRANAHAAQVPSIEARAIFVDSYKIGALEAMCREQAAVLRTLIDHYLAPRRSPRGRQK